MASITWLMPTDLYAFRGAFRASFRRRRHGYSRSRVKCVDADFSDILVLAPEKVHSLLTDAEENMDVPFSNYVTRQGIA